MKDFIKQQQELTRKELGKPAEGYSHYNVDGCTVERLIEQAITNTGKELMRPLKSIGREESKPWSIEDEVAVRCTEIFKKHITSLTGVE